MDGPSGRWSEGLDCLGALAYHAGLAVKAGQRPFAA